MSVLRDPIVVVVGFVQPSEGVGGTTGLAMGLAKLGPLMLSNGQVDGVGWLRLRDGWRQGISDMWFTVELRSGLVFSLVFILCICFCL